jgi:DNA-binding NtrC family response regulator
VQQYDRPGGILVSRGLCLIIEDDQDIRDLLTLILTRMGFEVHAVANGAQGWLRPGNTTRSWSRWI